ncbi:hypothetical protein DJ017_10320 [Phenylobacterium soli]|uniref:Uncharacterized protein n=1 Tax=Phenylobacterium soli TaxID=2170551 RepID=A0A328AIX4_9CAUL|nr:hypothetical protein DJ017_10320 [Phenylobacterium soli]
MVGGWESLTASKLTGVCRTAFPWTDNAAVLNIAFGTHSGLQLWQGGAMFDITPASGFTAGAVDGAGSAGFGTGAFGVGGYGLPSTGDYFPLTWSFAAWGQNLLASPRNQTIFAWTNNTAAKAAPLANAPANVTHMLVAPLNGGYQVFALGCNEEVSGVFNPLCIRHSSIRNNSQWSTSASGSTAREYVLTGGGRIVAGRMAGPVMLVWTSDALFLGTYVGALNQPWRFDRVGRNCGLIGPNAAVVVGQSAFWVSPDRQFYRYVVGGEPEPIPCPIRQAFAENVAASQGDKIVASSNAEFGEVRFDYPDGRDGYENSRYLALCLTGPDAGSWYRGIMGRTTFVDAGPSAFPVGVAFDGAVYFHEKGRSADGAPFSWFVETADSYLDPEHGLLVRGLWPDFKGQVGPVNVTVTARRTPQGAEVSSVPAAMAAGDAKTDLLLSGRLFKVRFSGASAPTACRIGEPVFDVAATGLL